MLSGGFCLCPVWGLICCCDAGGSGRAVGEGQYVDFGAVDIFGKWEQLRCGGRQGVLKHSFSNRQKGIVQGARAPWTCCSRGCSPTPRVPVRADPHTAVMGAQRESGGGRKSLTPSAVEGFYTYIYFYLFNHPLGSESLLQCQGLAEDSSPFLRTSTVAAAAERCQQSLSTNPRADQSTQQHREICQDYG